MPTGTADTQVSPAIIRRRSKPDKPDTPDEPSTRYKVSHLYSSGKSYQEIADETGWNVASIKRQVQKHYSSMRELLETETLIESQKADNVSMVNTPAKVKTYRNQKKLDKNINKNFLEKISDPDAETLTNEEVMFAYLMVHEGDEINALSQSGLAEGLAKSNPGYRRAIKMRCIMLKGKRNMIKYINSIQVDYARELNVSKEVIQAEILQQLHTLKNQNNPKLAPTIAKLTEQLGRTVGAFSDKITIQEVSFDDAMDEMMDMRRAKIKEIEDSKGGDAAETYVYDPDKIK